MKLPKRSLKVSIIKDEPNAIEYAAIDPEQVDEIITRQTRNIALTIGAVMLTKKAADTLSELILIAGRRYI